MPVAVSGFVVLFMSVLFILFLQIDLFDTKETHNNIKVSVKLDGCD